MKYEKIWKRSVIPGEEVKYEFTVALGYRIFFLVVGILVGLPFLWVGFTGPVVFTQTAAMILGALIICISVFYSTFYLPRANAYAFTNRRVLIHKGWLSTEMTSVDYSKITNVNVIEPIFDRIVMGCGNMEIITAGTTEDQIRLKYISAPYEVKRELDSLMAAK